MKDAVLLHYSHCVSDIEKSRRFYTQVLGFEVMAEFDFDDPKTAQVMMVPGARFKGIFMQRDGQRIEIIGFTNPKPTGARRPHFANEIGHSHFTFNVRSIDAALAELREHGIEPEPGSRAQLHHGIECCVIRDPDGFGIELVSAPKLGIVPYRS
jgi:lactoylglutathione lyase